MTRYEDSMQVLVDMYLGTKDAPLRVQVDHQERDYALRAVQRADHIHLVDNYRNPTTYECIKNKFGGPC